MAGSPVTAIAASNTGNGEVVAADPVETAKSAGLRYVNDTMPGIRRKRAGDHFRYVDARGEPVRDEETLARIRSLAIPPAWTDVWISPWAHGHLQATGRDGRGRKQYRYHPRWREVRDENKYARMLAFGEALPVIRERVDHDLGLPGMPREKVLATVVRLLEMTLIRVGNEEYARENRSYGLTTLRNRHVDVNGSSVEFHFEGKGGKKHRISVKDRRLATIVRRCREIPGQELFQYVDEVGERQTVDSADVNEYLRSITGQDFTAKDFRTWAGTVAAAIELRMRDAAEPEGQAKSNVVRAVESVAERLGNTASISRKCYIHPAVIEAYLEGRLAEACATDEVDLAGGTLHPDEAAVMALLRRLPS